MRLPRFLTLIGAACVLAAPLAAQQSPARPNIIYIYADDLGYGELGSYGQEKIKTPHLDQLAREGIRFTEHYASAPVCAPSRCMLLTGRHAGHSFIRGNYEFGQFGDDQEGGQMPLPEHTVTIARLLQAAGYATGAVGKWGLGMANTTGAPLKQGFDYFYGYLDQKQAHNYYPTHLWENDRWDTLRNNYLYVHDKIAPGSPPAAFERFKGKDYAIDKMSEKAFAFLDQNQHQPFFLYLPFTIPHVSLQVPDHAMAPYKGAFDDSPYYGEQRYTPNQHPRATYAAMITYLDQQVGRVLAKIKALGLDDNTIILFSSDNGTTFNGGTDAAFFNSVAGLRGLKAEIYEGGIKVPFIARWPGKIPPNTVSDFVSAQYDMFATLTEIAGVPTPANDGLSLWPVMTGKGPMPTREYLYFEFPEADGQMAIRMGPYKGVKTNMKSDRNAPWQLYHLGNDPSESTDIAGAHPAVIERLNQIVKQAHTPATIREWEIVDPKF